jgi:ABC-type branched-subunit amino acid transport system ATPase component
MNAPLLQARGLRKHFAGVRAVDGVDFAINAGEMVALIGPNGAGKSTLFGLIAGQHTASSGEVLFDNRPVGGHDPAALARAGIGRTFQTAQTWGTLTVLQNVQLALVAAAGRTFDPWTPLDDIDAAAAQSLLARVDLGSHASRAASALPYPDSKRLELAIALAGAPRLLLMDEPTAGMAAAERTALMDLVRSLVEAQAGSARPLTVLFTEHSMDVVFGYARRVLVMARGRLIADGLPDDVRADPAAQAAYFGGSDEAAT